MSIIALAKIVSPVPPFARVVPTCLGEACRTALCVHLTRPLRPAGTSPSFSCQEREGDGAGAPGATGPVSDPETLYQTAYSDYLRGNYDLALLGFRQYLESFPETDLADNASYWIGECFYRQQKFAEAIAQYDEVLSRWPRSDKTANSQLKKGYAQIELGRRDDGIRQLQAVARDFPNSDEANLARQSLQSLGVATGQKRQ